MKQYGLTAEGLRRIRDAADPDKRHTYEWYVIENINTPEEHMECTPVLEDAVRMYAALNGGDKRLGVTKDGMVAGSGFRRTVWNRTASSPTRPYRTPSLQSGGPLMGKRPRKAWRMLREPIGRRIIEHDRPNHAARPRQ